MSLPRTANDSSAGTSVSVRMIAAASANDSVQAIGEKIFPSTRWNVKIGRKARMMIAFENRIGLPIDTAVLRSTWMRQPSVWCWIAGSALAIASFTISASTSTTALSTMIPKSTEPSEIRFADTPFASIRMNADSSDSGITAATIAAARQSRRKTSRIATTSSAPTARFSVTVCTVCFTSSVRS